jgi:hypothetical protein
MRCRLFHVDRTIGIIMIAAMLTLVMVALLIVALMFAAEIGWLMIGPTSPPAQAHRVRAERRATHCVGRETAPRGNGDESRNASGSV